MWALSLQRRLLAYIHPLSHTHRPIRAVYLQQTDSPLLNSFSHSHKIFIFSWPRSSPQCLESTQMTSVCVWLVFDKLISLGLRPSSDHIFRLNYMAHNLLNAVVIMDWFNRKTMVRGHTREQKMNKSTEYLKCLKFNIGFSVFHPIGLKVPTEVRGYMVNSCFYLFQST